MTPAILAADRAGIRYAVHEYSHDPAAPSYGLEAAIALGVDPARVLKTLIVEVDGRLVMALVPVEGSLNLRALAAVVGGKRAVMADLRVAERATGYVVGGISPLGQKRAMQAVIDESALTWDRVFVSGGRRGVELELEVGDLVRLLEATLAVVARNADPRSV